VRLDHIAYRVVDRWKTAEFFIKAFGYTMQEEFKPYGDDSVQCIALRPSERQELEWVPFLISYGGPPEAMHPVKYHLAPEIFISDGKPDSVVGKWVKDRNGIGGIHHLAYEVYDVQEEVDRWLEKGWGNFLSDDVLTCPGIKQIFSEEMGITGGMIFEFIERRADRGFCKENVKALMDSTRKNNDAGND